MSALSQIEMSALAEFRHAEIPLFKESMHVSHRNDYYEHARN